MASFESAFSALGRQFDALKELSPSEKASLMAGSLTVLEDFLSRAREANRTKQESAESAAGVAADEVVQKILGLFAEKIYRKVLDVRDIFLEFDYSGEGTIHAADFAHALARLGLPVSDSQLAALVRLFDTDEDGSIDYGEFCRAVEDATFLSRDEASSLSRSLGAAAAASGRSGRGPATTPRPSPEASVTAALRHLRSHVWNKHGTMRAAWQAYHAGSAGGSMKLARLVRACQREGYPLTMRALQRMLGAERLPVAPLSFSTFRSLLARPAPSAAASALAMGGIASPGVHRGPRREPRDGAASARGPPDHVATYRDYEAADPAGAVPGAERVKSMDIVATYERALAKVGRGLERTSYSSKRLHDTMVMSGADGCPPHDLRRGLHRIGCDISELEAEVLVARFDEDRDGQLDFKEFLHLVREAAEAVA